HGSGHVLDLHVGALRHRYAQLRQHVGQALLGEGRLAHLVTRTIQGDHEAVAHQLIGACALNRSQILDALRCCRRREAHAQRCRRKAAQECGPPLEVGRGARHGQNGAMFRKKRCSQPMVWTSSITPLLRNSIRASATCVDDTVLLPVIERGSTTPEKRRCSLPRLMAICLSPAICRLPLGSTPTTVVVSVPVERLSARVEPSPSRVLPPVMLESWFGLTLPGRIDGTAPQPRFAPLVRSVEVATRFCALVRS